MHISKWTKKKSGKSRSKDVQDFIDTAEFGVVYFSFGGNLKPSEMAPEKKEAIINSLSKLKEKILWKWDDESVKVDRKKFFVKKWFQQEDILAHRKVKLFVTHGGLLSGTEAIYHAKPLVVIPIFGDQKFNAARVVANGIGVKVDYKNLTETSFTWALNEVLANSKYTKRVEELSKRFHDKPNHPLDLAKFYVEYVLRHKGAPFLTSSATYLNFFEIHNLDVFAILGIILISIFMSFYWFLRKVFRYFAGSETKKSKTSKVKKN